MPGAPPTTLLSDDFNDNVRDTAKWTLGSLSEGTTAYDPAVGVSERNQRLEITPLSGTTGQHYGGYLSAQTYDLTSGRVSVEGVQILTSGSGATMNLAVVVDSNNWYRVLAQWGNLYFQKKINGWITHSAVPYNATQHRYWRIRHDTADQIIWETSSDQVSWTVQRQEARQLSVKSLKVEVQAGTSQAESAPGTAIFDNFKLETNVYGWQCDNIYQGGSIMAMEETTSTSYLVSDSQGSKRLVLNSSGGVMARHDYYPFGEAIQAGVGMRTSGQGFGATDRFRSRFAGTEGDAGTGLEHTLWRKMESRSGRWTSVDPYRGSMRRSNPQTFNRYSYGGNDPVNRVDPTGLQPQEYDPSDILRIYTSEYAWWRGLPGYGGGVSAGSFGSWRTLDYYLMWQAYNEYQQNLNRNPPQSGFRYGNVPFTDDQKQLLADAYNRINQDNCKSFINNTLANANYGVGQDFNSLEKLLTRANLSFYDTSKLGLLSTEYTPSELGVDANGAILLQGAFLNGASAATYQNNIFLSSKVFDRPWTRYGGGRFADTPSYIVHELFHVAGIKQSIVDSQSLVDDIQKNCRLTGSERIVLAH